MSPARGRVTFDLATPVIALCALTLRRGNDLQNPRERATQTSGVTSTQTRHHQPESVMPREIDTTSGHKSLAQRSWLVSGTAAAVTSTALLSLCGLIENGNPVGPSNGPSQWIYGRKSARRRHFSLRHTVPAYLIHHSSALFWSRLHQALFVRDPAQPRTLQRRVAEGAATAAVACFVDYRCTPKRLQPGFEQQLSRTSLLVVYAGFGAALGIATHLLTRGRGRDPR